MNDGDDPRPLAPEHRYEDRPFALRQPPQEIAASVLMFLAVVGLHLWWTSHPVGQRVALARWALPLEVTFPALLCFWIYGRAKRTNRPKTARVMLLSALIFFGASIFMFAFVTYLTTQVESALGPGWQRQP